MNVNVFVNNMDYNAYVCDSKSMREKLPKNVLQASQPLIEQGGIGGINLHSLVRLAMEKHQLDPSCGIEVDYWSNELQTFIMCGICDPSETEEFCFIAEEELLLHRDASCLLLRFKNCTGNVIDFTDGPIA